MVTIGTSTAAALALGAAGLGAAGLAGLGIAAAFAGGRGRGRRGGRGRGGFRRGGGRGRRFRGRRDVNINDVNQGVKNITKKESLPDKKVPTTKEQFLKDEERILQAIRESDEDLCSFRLVCELSGVNPEELTPDEYEILRFVHEGDQGVAPGEGVLPTNSNLMDYQSAARLGAGGYMCSEIYQTCQSTAAQMMGVIRALV